jgi:hypothetical protein
MSPARALTCAAVVLLLSFPAVAQVEHKCGSWRRLSPDQKLQAIDQAIENLVSSNRGREFTSINRTRTRRCLERHRDQMVDDFDAICSEGMRVGLGALNDTFRSYVWTCAQ